MEYYTAVKKNEKRDMFFWFETISKVFKLKKGKDAE